MIILSSVQTREEDEVTICASPHSPKDYQNGGPINIKLISLQSESDRREIQLKILGSQVDQGFDC